MPEKVTKIVFHKNGQPIEIRNIPFSNEKKEMLEIDIQLEKFIDQLNYKKSPLPVYYFLENDQMI